MANDAELLADLLDGRLDPAQVPAELAELAELAGAVSEHITLVPPTPDFRAALREELLQTVGGTGGGPSSGGSSLGDGASGVTGSGGATPTGGAAGTASAASAASGIPAIVAAVAATAVLATSTYVATSESVPGDPLYGLKHGIESLQLTIADDARDVELLVGFATERVREAIGLEDPAVVSDLLLESERLLNDALALAVAQGRQVQDLLDDYASALVTLDSRTDAATVQAQLDQLMADVGVAPSPLVPTPVTPGLEPDAPSGSPGDTPDEDVDEPGDRPSDEPSDKPSETPLDDLDDPLDDPLDDLDDPLDDPLDPLDDTLDELDDTLEETTDTLGG